MPTLQYMGRIGRYNQFRQPRRTVSANGLVYVVSYGANAIFMLDACTKRSVGAIRTPNLVRPRGMIVRGGRLYVSCYGNPIGQILIIDQTTGCEIHNFRVPRPRGIAMLGQQLFVTEVMKNRISIFKTNGEFVNYIYAGFRHPRGIDVDRMRGLLLVADSGNNRVVWLTSSGRVTRICKGLDAPNDVLICSDGMVVVSQWYRQSLRLMSRGSRVFGPEISVPGGSGNFAMLGQTGRRLVVADDDGGCLHLFTRRSTKKRHEVK